MINSAVDGVWGDLDCMVLDISLLRADGSRSDGVYKLWLAVDRNYIPVRFEYQMSRGSPPANDAVVDGFAELQSGVWFPERVTKTVYDPVAAREGLQGEVVRKTIFELVSATVTPEYADDEFALPEFEAGTIVSVYEDGEKVDRFVVEEDGAVEPSVPRIEGRSEEPSRWPWVAGLLALGGLGFAAVRGRRRSG